MNIVDAWMPDRRFRYLLDGVDVRRLDDTQFVHRLIRKIGFIFQSFI